MTAPLEKVSIDTVVKVLSQTEKSHLAHYEETISYGLKTFFEVGKALAQIQKENLYRAEFKTFEEYCKVRWDFTRQHVWRLVRVFEAVQEMKNVTPGLHLEGPDEPPETAFVIPASEKVFRPILDLPPEQRASAWRKALALANGKPTHRSVQALVNELQGGTAVPAVVAGSEAAFYAVARKAESLGTSDSTGGTPVPPPSRAEQLRADLDMAIAAVRKVQDDLGTAYSADDGQLPAMVQYFEKKKAEVEHAAELERERIAREKESNRERREKWETANAGKSHPLSVLPSTISSPS